MKKIIAIILALLALSALTVTAFAAVDAVPADEPAEAAEIEAKLTEADALAAALKDAGEAEADVTVTKNKLSEKETADGGFVAVYTVKFSTDTTDYQYILDADTGAVLYKSIEFQSPDVVFKSIKRSNEGDRGEKAGGEMGGNDRGMKSSGEPEADGVSEAGTRGGGRSSGRRAASGEPEVTDELVDAVSA